MDRKTAEKMVKEEGRDEEGWLVCSSRLWCPGAWWRRGWLLVVPEEYFDVISIKSAKNILIIRSSQK